MKRAILLGVFGMAALHARSSNAQPSSRALAAEELFRDGRALIAKHRYKQACEKLSASQKIEPAVGTLVSLGECYSGEGRAASAWLAYRSAIALAAARGDPRRGAADERAAAMEPLISNVAIHMGGDATAPGLQISIDGEGIDREVLGSPVPIDPGSHTVAASAPGYRTWLAQVHVGAIADNVSVEIPALEPLPDASAIERARHAAATKRTAGLVLGGAGVVGLGVGAILGLQAIVKIRDANRACPGVASCTDASALHENKVGGAYADASTVALPVSAALLAAGAFLFFTSHDPRGAEVGADVTPCGARVRIGWAW